MSFSRITPAQLALRGATTLPDQPTISASALKQEFDAPAKDVVAPKVNGLMDELEDTTASQSLGASSPTGRVYGTTVQGMVNGLSDDLATAETNIVNLQAEAHSHLNKALLDTYTQTEADLADAVAMMHSHTNKGVLDKFSETTGGKPAYDSNELLSDAITSVKVGSNIIPASGKTEFELVAGSNVSMTVAGNSVTISSSGGGGGGGGGGDMEKADYCKDGITDTVDKAHKLYDGVNILTATVAELNNMSGATGNIQTQLNAKAEATTVPHTLDDLNDVTITTPSADQVIKYDAINSKWINGAAPASGHTMIANNTAIATMKTNSQDPTDDKVASTYAISNWSNAEIITLYTTVAKDTDTVGAWNDNWKTDGIRTGWLWHSALHDVLSDDEVEIELAFDVSGEEVVSLYAYRVDDDVQNSGVDGGAIAIKLNGAIKNASGVKVAINLKRQRTQTDNLTVLS